MRRRDFIALLGGAAAAWPMAARAQQGEKRQITIWMGRPNDAEGLRLAVAFREALQALGWTNGRNVRIDYRWVTSDIDRLSLAKEVVEQQPDVIVAETTAAVTALSRVTRTIPIVFVNVSDPIGGGFVGSLAQPGGVITGFISNEPTLGSKWPGLLKEIAPAVERLAFLFNPDTAPYAESFLRQAEAGAVSLGLQLSALPIHNDPEIERTIITLTSAPCGGLIVLPEAFTNTHSARIIELAAQHRLPTIYTYRFQAAAGVCYPTALISPNRSGPLHHTSIVSSVVKSQPTYPYRLRPNSPLSSTSPPPRRSASRSPRRFSPAPTR
jgi:putative tryptophan/tyrosine transport system substrate-binding protein